jgi:hypothetical protein
MKNYKIDKNAKFKRKKKLILTLILMSFFLSNIVFSKETKKSDKVDTGMGVNQGRELQPFDAINISGVGNLYITQSTTQGLSINADETILPLIKVSVVNKVLYIALQNASDHAEAKINYHLNIKEIKEINSHGNLNIFIQDGFNAQVLDLVISNLGEVYIKKLNVGKLNVKINSGSTVEASGVADQQSISINGAGVFNGSKLSGQLVAVDIVETGIVKINASNNLTTTIAGEGTVQYCGDPKITKQAFSKAAIITKLPEQECK